MNPRLSKIFSYKEYKNSDEIFSIRLQICIRLQVTHMSKLYTIYFSLI